METDRTAPEQETSPPALQDEESASGTAPLMPDDEGSVPNAAAPATPIQFKDSLPDEAAAAHPSSADHVEPSPAEVITAERAYKRARAWARALFGISVAAVAFFFVLVLVLMRIGPDTESAQAANSTFVAGLGGGLIALITVAALGRKIQELAEQKGLSAARRARKRFRERQHAIYGQQPRQV